MTPTNPFSGPSRQNYRVLPVTVRNSSHATLQECHDLHGVSYTLSQVGYIDSDGIPSLKKRNIQKSITSIMLRDEIKKRMPERNLLDIMCLAQNTTEGMVSAWCEANQLVLGQIKTEEKSNEITAISKLLKLLDITKSIVIIDAMGCQRVIADQIVKQNADYILAVKGNQGSLHESIKKAFNHAQDKKFKDMVHDQYIVENKGH